MEAVLYEFGVMLSQALVVDVLHIGLNMLENLY
jgi:hypothetical protein